MINALTTRVVHTGQNYDYTLNEIFFEELGLRRPDHFLEAPGNTLGETIGNVIARSYEVMVKERPDALLILGDTNSALCAIAAKRLKIPIFHMEAGNRCFDENVPEEINRKIVDHISDVNLPYTEHARRYLLDEGLRPEHIFVTGSPLAEVLGKHRGKIHESSILKVLGLESRKFFLASAHREENIDNEKNFFSLMDAFNGIARRHGMPVIYSAHPRSKDRIARRNPKLHDLVRSHRPFGFYDYNHLQMNALCVLSDSGTLSEESAILGFNGVLIRTSTERPEAVDTGSIVLGGITEPEIEEAIQLSLSLPGLGIPDAYFDRDVSVKVARIIQGYTEIVNKRVWSK